MYNLQPMARTEHLGPHNAEQEISAVGTLSGCPLSATLVIGFPCGQIWSQVFFANSLCRYQVKKEQKYLLPAYKGGQGKGKGSSCHPNPTEEPLQRVKIHQCSTSGPLLLPSILISTDGCTFLSQAEVAPRVGENWTIGRQQNCLRQSCGSQGSDWKERGRHMPPNN